jgi:drug/metabolite transporter (DMT)-like permease
MTNHKKSLILAIAAVILWSTIGSAFKITLRYIEFDSLLFFASIVSLLVFLVILIVRRKLFLFGQLTKKDFRQAAILGLLNPFLYYLVLLKAYSLLLAQEAGTLNYIWPLVLVLLSIPLLGQKISFAGLLAVIISFSGTVIIGTRGEFLSLGFSNPLGVALTLVSAVLWSLYWIFGMKDKKDEALKLFLNFSFGLVYILFYLLLTGRFVWPSVYGWIGSVYIGTFEMGITFFLWLNALKYANTTAKISNLVFLSPFISLIFIHFFVGEKILSTTIAGLTFIVGGILLQQIAGKDKRLEQLQER